MSICFQRQRARQDRTAAKTCTGSDWSRADDDTNYIPRLNDAARSATDTEVVAISVTNTRTLSPVYM